MNNKRVLMFCYPTFHAYYWTHRYVEAAIGYEVVLTGVEIDIPNAISIIDRDNPQLLAVDGLAGFDAIVITVEERKLDIASSIIPQEFIDDLRERVKFAEAKKGNSIPIIGVNFGLSGQQLQEQVEVFGGLFIDQVSELENIRRFTEESGKE